MIPTNRPGQGGLPQNPNQPPRRASGNGLPSNPSNKRAGLPQGLPSQQNPSQRPTRPTNNPDSPLTNPNRPDPGAQRPKNPYSQRDENTSGNLNYREDGLPELSNENPLHSGRMSRANEPSRVRSLKNETIVNSYDSPEDDTFSSIPIEEQIEEAEIDPYEEEELERERAEAERRRLLEDARSRKAKREEEELEKLNAEEENNKQDQAEALAAKSKRKSKKVKENKKDDSGQDVFIDEEKLKLEPYGNKNRKSIKVSDFDDRKNKARNAAIVRYSFLGLAALIALLGVKSSFFPPEQWTAEEIQELSLAANDITGFPIDAGKGFAVDFMKAYLSDSKDKVGNTVLGYFYSGKMQSESTDTRYMHQNLKQKVLYGPTVYSVTPLTEHSTSYVVGALVESSNAEAAAPNDASASHWEFFNVNVYRNSSTGALSITPDSPTVVPPSEIMSATDVPAPDPVGTGTVDETLTESLTSVVHGFLKGYASSTATDHSALDQYIVNDADHSLKRGLEGQYSFAGGIESAVKFSAYPTSVPNEVKVKVSVRWANDISGNKEIRSEYNSNYIMTLEKQSNEKYLVSKFAPEYFVAYDALENTE